jgi:hypothetical protein
MSKSQLQKILEEAGHDCYSYSGRGMFGKSCLAFNYGGSWGEVYGDILEAALEQAGDKGFDETGLVESVRQMRSDSMGTSTVFYFPRTEFVDEEDSEEDDVEDDEEEQESEEETAQVE